MRLALPPGLVVLFMSGCTQYALRDSTLDQSRTLTDIHYRVVLDNLAMLPERKGSLPWGMRITQGTATVTDGVSGTFSYAWSPVSRTLSATPSRQWQLGWTLVPVTDSSDLDRKR